LLDAGNSSDLQVSSDDAPKKKLFVSRKKGLLSRILRIARIKNQRLQSGRFGKSGYHYKILSCSG
jgi:hypothetical protein